MKKMFNFLNPIRQKNYTRTLTGVDAEESCGTKTAFSKLFLMGAVFAFGLLLSNEQGKASDWMFQQSYYSHYLPEEVAQNYPQPESRYAYRRAYANFLPGVSIKGATRFNRIYLRNGNSTDVTILREDWFQFQP